MIKNKFKEFQSAFDEEDWNELIKYIDMGNYIPYYYYQRMPDKMVLNLLKEGWTLGTRFGIIEGLNGIKLIFNADR